MASQKDFHTTLLGRKCVRVPSREVETDAFLPSDGLLACRKKMGGSTFLLNPKGPRRTLVDSGGENVSNHISDKGVIYFRFVNLSVYAAFAFVWPCLHKLVLRKAHRFKNSINLGSNSASATYHKPLYKPLQISEPPFFLLYTGINYNSLKEVAVEMKWNMCEAWYTEGPYWTLPMVPGPAGSQEPVGEYLGIVPAGE